MFNLNYKNKANELKHCRFFWTVGEKNYQAIIVLYGEKKDTVMTVSCNWLEKIVEISKIVSLILNIMTKSLLLWQILRNELYRSDLLGVGWNILESDVFV